MTCHQAYLSENRAPVVSTPAPRRVDKMFPTQQGFMCFMNDGTIWLFSGYSWKHMSEVPQGKPEEEEKKASALIR